MIVADRSDPSRGVACGIVTNVNPGGKSIRVDFTSNGASPTGTALAAGGGLPDLVAVPAHVYTVVNNQLLRDGMVLADDVEDLQIAFFYDVDQDGMVDSEAAEYPGSAGGQIYQSGSGNWDNSDLLEIRVSVVVRTRTQDADVVQNPAMAQGQWQATENRVAPGGFDGFRRRVHTATVRPRNVGIRPLGSV